MDKTEVKKKEKYISILFIIISVVFWGYSFISTKIVLREIPPVTIAFFRQIIAAVTLAVWLLFTKAFRRVKLKDFMVMAASALFGIVLYFVFENHGLKYTTASNASMIVSTVPIFTLITEALFFKLKIKRSMFFFVAISIIGVYFVVTVNGELNLSSSTFLGNVLVLGAMVTWVLYVILNKSLDPSYSSVLVTFYQTISSIFLFIPFIISEAKDWKPVTAEPLLNLIYLGVFCSALAYFFYIYATRRLGATLSAAFLNLIPVITVISGYFTLGEKLSIMQYIGMILIIASLFGLSRVQPSE